MNDTPPSAATSAAASPEPRPATTEAAAASPAPAAASPASSALTLPASKANALSVVPATASSLALVSADNALDLLRDMTSSGISIYDLTRVKVPAGGVTVWTVQTLEGEQNPREIEVCIAYRRSRLKSWWAPVIGPDGKEQTGTTGTPPNCYSFDSVTGFGNPTVAQTPGVAPTHDCVSCQWNRWGSDRRGSKGKDCKDFAELYAFRENSRMPLLFGIPPGSLKAFNKYVMDLANEGLQLHGVTTKLSLFKERNEQGQDYSRVVFALGRRLAPAEMPRVEAAGAILAQWLAEQARSQSPSVVANDLHG